MNNKGNILNAWITVEKLAEGSIDKKDQELRTYDKQINDWENFFLEFLNKHKAKEKLSDENFKKSGLALFFEIFDFEEVISILRNKYNIQKAHEERINSDKFSFVIYLDNKLNFLGENFFYTMSGYIRNKGDIPENISKEECAIRSHLFDKFAEEDFNTSIFQIFQEYQVSPDNFRYKFVKDLEYDATNLHSFFIKDLEKAKNINTNNLSRYFGGFSGERRNLDSNRDSQYFNADILEKILQPKYYPMGRFPSESNYALSFMQQVAVNLVLNDYNDICSVNGPPGTGKTTLLKDVFSDLLVQQALAICQLSDKSIPESLVYWKQAKLGVLPNNIADKNIVVASSNNGAVQNIVNELPRKKNIGSEFLDKLIKADYFKDISNSEIEGKGFGKEREIILKKLPEKNWGAFSLEGGTSKNISNLLLTVEAIENYLKEDYESQASCYQEFLGLYDKLSAERMKIQKYSEQLRELSQVSGQYEKEIAWFKEEKVKKQADLTRLQTNIEIKIQKLEQESICVHDQINGIFIKLDSLNDAQVQAERNYEVIKAQSPSLLWVQKIFNKSKVNQYFEELKSANQMLNSLLEQKNSLMENKASLDTLLRQKGKESNYCRQEIGKAKDHFIQWCSIQQNKLQKLKHKIEALKKDKVSTGPRELDFSQTYAELQKSNPWFGMEFRVLQSELFISALKVKKQFLFDNVKCLSRALMIWKKQQEHVEKENGRQIIAAAWQWLNFTIPVISTTFASFGIMFRNLGENSISNLFIDEAGQALPQASVGAIFRSKKVMVVGDPAQIKPVLTLDSKILGLIGRHYDVDEEFVSATASTQTIIDATSQYGFMKDGGEWIGIPLWVHRRTDYPMFTISNEISYNGLMVQGKPKDMAKGKAQWFHSTGKANDKYVKEQADLLIELISEQMQKDPQLANEIYVISPFKNVAYRLAQDLERIKFTKRKNKKPTNVGTVHTFQGKEAKVVYLVLGADSASAGAAGWAVSEPNIMNVAATRAKEEFYIIGDKQLYSSLGSKVANRTISIIEDYNNLKI